MSSSSFKNIIIHEEIDGQVKSYESNVNDLLMQEKNQFTGFECWAGVQNITIDNKGDVYRAICKQGNKLGNIETGFTLPGETIICQKKFCNCAADIQLTKQKVGAPKVTRTVTGN